MLLRGRIDGDAFLGKDRGHPFSSPRALRRIANARLDPTYLMADVEIVATYELFNVNRAKLESLIHKVFGAARLDVEIKDRFGQPIVPKEWFLAPLFAVDEAVSRIRDGTITGYVYDPKTAKLALASALDR